jgi:glycosyltransferase 2 family protein
VTAFWHTFTSAGALLTHIRAGFALGALGMYLASVVVVAFRWRLILAALGVKTTVWNSLLTYSAGVFVGNVTPARTLGNDAVRLTLIRTRTTASVKAATASVVYDRASELPAITVIALLAMPTIRPPLVVVLAIVAVLAVLAFVPAVRAAISMRIAKWHDAIVGVPVSRGSVAAALGCSMVVWLQDITRITLVAAAFGVFLSPSQAATLTSIRLLSGLIPIPGGVGVVEGSAIAALVWFGIPVETATAITIIERAVLYGCGTLIGAVSLALLGGRRVLDRRAKEPLLQP